MSGVRLVAPPERVSVEAPTHPPFALARQFDRLLGDPDDPCEVFSHERCAALDAGEEFPADVCRMLDGLGLPAHYVPEEHGGRLRSYEDVLQLMRVVAARDLTVAIAHGKTYLGAVCVWVAGTPEQAGRLGREITRGAVASWGLTEREHGSDLLAGELTALPTGGGYRVDGEKWLINNATRGRFVSLLARTARDAGPRGLSLLLIDKERLAPGSYRCLPAARTHGIRGADISGIAFEGAEVPRTALIGEEGTGLETVLKSLQLTRTLCAALSLGAADHALRLGTDFTLEHRLYGSLLIDLPQSRRVLGESYADLLAAEATSVVASRSIHALTGEMSVVSAATKFAVPTGMEQLIGRLGQLLGARAFLTETFRHGRFQKLERDHRIVSIFDGNTLVNLNMLVNQFTSLARNYREGRTDEAGLATAVSLREPLPAFDRDRLSLVARRGASVVQSLPAATDALLALVADGELPASLGPLAARLRETADEVHQRMAEYRPTARQVPADAFALAKRYTLLFSAACCVQLWLRNRSERPEDALLWRDPVWLEACLGRLMEQLRPGGREDFGAYDRLLGRLREQYDAGAPLTLLNHRENAFGGDRA
ncbi:acyl-CoA dehydrogenase family protein [Streptomyces sp. NPDC005811]|uniref:acyl-CoA dehydrogenase family protein n=1 Tax=Streptomyces sp. NPDC005811 TaxID=3154565 RepID=UPI0033D2ECEC